MTAIKAARYRYTLVIRQASSPGCGNKLNSEVFYWGVLYIKRFRLDCTYELINNEGE